MTSINSAYIKQLFSHLQTGNSNLFFEKVADDVSWTVMGTHPLAGHYNSKKVFLEHTFSRLNNVLQEGVILKVNNIMIEGNYAAVEMVALSHAKNGKPFNNAYCWIVKFDNDMIVEVRAYLDSALVQKVIDENE